MPKTVTHNAEINKVVGRNIRSRRKFLDMTCKDLAALAGISGEQIRKYEIGSNKIGADTMYVFAEILGVDINYFYTGFSFEQDPVASCIAEEIAPLNVAYMKIRDENLRKQVLQFVSGLGNS